MNELVLARQLTPPADAPWIVGRRISNAHPARVVPTVVDLNLDVQSGAFAVLLGAAKTGVVRLLAALERPRSGELSVGGVPLTELDECGALAYRRTQVNVVWAAHDLLPRLTLQENLELPLLLSDVATRERRDRARSALELVGLGGFAKRRPSEVSRGTAQRASIARALVNGAHLILLDEPCAELDARERRAVLDLLTQLNQLFRKTIVIGTLDPSLAPPGSQLLRLASTSTSATWPKQCPTERAARTPQNPALEALSA